MRKLLARRREREAAMPFVMLTVLIDMVSIGLVIPVLPVLVGHFTDSPQEQAFWYGAVVFVFGFANFIGSPILGALSDAYGRRPVLLLGFCGLGLNFFATGLATQLWMLMCVRVIGGAMQSNQAVANAYVADITPPEQRAKRFGMLGAMFGLGFIVGPVMGGLLGKIDVQLPFFVAGGMAMLNLAYGFFVLPESLPPSSRKPFNWRRATPYTALKSLTKLHGIGVLVAAIACSALAQFVTYTSWVLYTTFKFGWDTEQNGLSLAAVGIMSVIVQGLLLGRLLKFFSPRRLAIVGLLSSSIGYFFWGFANQGWIMYAVIFGNVLGYTVQASIQSIISTAAHKDDQGATMGAVSSINSLMVVIAPLFSTPLLAVSTSFVRDDWRSGAPYYLCALLQACALILAFIQFSRQKKQAAETQLA